MQSTYTLFMLTYFKLMNILSYIFINFNLFIPQPPLINKLGRVPSPNRRYLKQHMDGWRIEIFGILIAHM